MAAEAIPSTGDGERHPDVRHLRNALSDYAAARLADAGSYDALAELLGGDWTIERVHAAHQYLKAQGHRRQH